MFTSFILVISIALLTDYHVLKVSLFICLAKEMAFPCLFPNSVNDFLMARDQQYVLLTIFKSVYLVLI